MISTFEAVKGGRGEKRASGVLFPDQAETTETVLADSGFLDGIRSNPAQNSQEFAKRVKVFKEESRKTT